MRNLRGVTPIISVVLLLMMTVAVAGLAWVWLQGMTTGTMDATKNMTDRQMQQMLTIIDIADYTAACDGTGAVKNITFQVFNRGTTNIDVNSVLINGKNEVVSPSVPVGAGSIGSITVKNNVPSGLKNTTTTSANVLLSSAQGYVTKTMTIDGARCNQ